MTNASRIPRGKTSDRSGEVAALLAAARAVLENRAFADAARAVLRACKTILGADAGLVAVRTAGRKDLEIMVLDPGSLELDFGNGLPASLRHLSARAAKVGRTVFANDLLQRSRKMPRPGGQSLPQSALYAPIVIAGEVAGLLGMIDKPGGFSAADSRLAEVFAEMSAVAMLRSHTVHGFESSQSVLETEVRDAATQLWQAEGKNAVLLEEAQASAARMQSLSRRLVEAQEGERRHIARELHDEAGQALASLRFGLRLLEREVGEGASAPGGWRSWCSVTDDRHRRPASAGRGPAAGEPRSPGARGGPQRVLSLYGIQVRPHGPLQGSRVHQRAPSGGGGDGALPRGPGGDDQRRASRPRDPGRRLGGAQRRSGQGDGRGRRRRLRTGPGRSAGLTSAYSG